MVRSMNLLESGAAREGKENHQMMKRIKVTGLLGARRSMRESSLCGKV
jgi:hypothetical protein